MFGREPGDLLIGVTAREVQVERAESARVVVQGTRRDLWIEWWEPPGGAGAAADTAGDLEGAEECWLGTGWVLTTG